MNSSWEGAPFRGSDGLQEWAALFQIQPGSNMTSGPPTQIVPPRKSVNLDRLKAACVSPPPAHILFWGILDKSRSSQLLLMWKG